MPQVSRQARVVPGTTPEPAIVSSANGAPPGAPPLGGLLGQMVPVSQLIDDWVKILMYGENGTGKTTLACEFPKPLALLAAEPNKTGGAKSVTLAEGVYYKRVTSRADILAYAKAFAADGGWFKTVVIDSATSLQDIILTEILGCDIPPEMLTWGMVGEDQYRQRSEVTRETLRPFLNLDKHVVVLAKQRDHRKREGDKRPKMLRGIAADSFFAADLGGATAGWLQDACDYLCQLYHDLETRTIEIPGTTIAGKPQPPTTREEYTGKTVRRLRTMYHPQFAARMRSPRPDQVPEYVEARTPREMYEKVMRVIRGEYDIKAGR